MSCFSYASRPDSHWISDTTAVESGIQRAALGMKLRKLAADSYPEPALCAAIWLIQRSTLETRVSPLICSN